MKHGREPISGGSPCRLRIVTIKITIVDEPSKTTRSHHVACDSTHFLNDQEREGERESKANTVLAALDEATARQRLGAERKVRYALLVAAAVRQMVRFLGNPE